MILADCAAHDIVHLFRKFREHDIFNEPHGDLDLLYAVEQVLIDYGLLEEAPEESVNPWNA